VYISALKGEGRGLLIDAVTERLELDTRRVRLEFDSSSAADRERIAGLYRHGRVLSHVTRDGRVAIEADLSRRALERLLGSSSRSALDAGRGL
jgi:50S ribosomal subunit-associated GTPase HflX